MGSFAWGGRQWGPFDYPEFRQWLAKRGVKFDTWASRHPKAASTFARTPDDVARVRAEQSVQPEIDLITRERTKAQDAAKGLAESNEGFTKALMGMLAETAPGTQKTYESAAGMTGAMAKGFADAEAAIQAGTAGSIEEFLQKAGAPSEAIEQAKASVGGTGTQDVLFGGGGFIPASGLLREGAAFTAAAQQLPAFAAGRGQQTSREIAHGARETDLDFAAQIAALKSKIPGLRQELLQQMREDGRAERALRLQEDYLGIADRKAGAEITGYDPVTGLPTYDAVAADAKAQGKKASDKAAANQKAMKAREDAFMAAEKSLMKSASGLIIREKNPHPLAGLDPRQPGTIEKRPTWTQAKKKLFAEYKYLLRHASKSGRFELRRRLNKMIDEALRAQGFKPPKVSGGRGL